MKKNNNVIRLKWESENEYTYRIETGKIIKVVAELLGNLEKVRYQDIAKITIIDDFRKLKNKANNLLIPSSYNKVHDYFLECIKSYCIASENFVESIKKQDSAFAIKSGRLIKKGNAFMEITKIEIYEVVEQKEQELSRK